MNLQKMKDLICTEHFQMLDALELSKCIEENEYDK